MRWVTVRGYFACTQAYSTSYQRDGNLSTAKGQLQYSAPGKVTVGLTSHRPFMHRRLRGISSYGIRKEMSSPPQVDSAFYPPWDRKRSTGQKAVMLCGWGVKAGMV